MSTMALFELIKNPDLAEQVTAEESSEEVPCEDLASSPFTVEIQQLRRRAEAINEHATANISPPQPLTPLGREFLVKCVAQAEEAADRPYESRTLDAPDTRFGSVLRVCQTTLLAGDWNAVVVGREAALAVVTELRTRGYASPCHRFDRNGAEWTLSIKFGF
jgi:hypothetical protein